jgi:hypothetical protein
MTYGPNPSSTTHDTYPRTNQYWLALELYVYGIKTLNSSLSVGALRLGDAPEMSLGLLYGSISGYVNNVEESEAL